MESADLVTRFNQLTAALDAELSCFAQAIRPLVPKRGLALPDVPFAPAGGDCHAAVVRLVVEDGILMAEDDGDNALPFRDHDLGVQLEIARSVLPGLQLPRSARA